MLDDMRMKNELSFTSEQQVLWEQMHKEKEYERMRADHRLREIEEERRRLEFALDREREEKERLEELERHRRMDQTYG